jgi:hypothetical protein
MGDLAANPGPIMSHGGMMPKKSSRRDDKKKAPPKPWYLRLSTWIGAILAAALTASGIALVQRGTESIVGTVDEIFTGPAAIEFETSSGPLAQVDIKQGMGCNRAGWVFPDTASPLRDQPGAGPTVNGHTWDQVPAKFDGVIGSGATLYISLTGPGDHAVLISDITFEVYERRAPRKGSVVNSVPSGCGNGVTYRYGAVDLDTKPPYYVSPPRQLPKGYNPLQFPYAVTANAPEVFRIDIYTRKCWCSWAAKLHWVDGAAKGEVVIDNKGRPFEMTPTRGLPAYEWPYGSDNSSSRLQRRDDLTDGPIWETHR